ncbi:MAG: FitA-like ribbon-helix-helix domain-containing protein [Alphaproteobacteria bacterium]|jgi:plasmid stability protein
MGTVTIRNLDDGVVERLKARAKLNNRSLESELRQMLTHASANEVTFDRQAIAARITALSLGAQNDDNNGPVPLRASRAR